MWEGIREGGTKVCMYIQYLGEVLIVYYIHEFSLI